MSRKWSPHDCKGEKTMGMSVQMKEAWKWAEEYETTLTAQDPRLRGCVIVHHDDGTSMTLPWAFMVRYHRDDGGTYIIVFTEHHGKQIFAEDELTGLVAWGGPPKFDTENFGPGAP